MLIFTSHMPTSRVFLAAACLYTMSATLDECGSGANCAVTKRTIIFTPLVFARPVSSSGLTTVVNITTSGVMQLVMQLGTTTLQYVGSGGAGLSSIDRDAYMFGVRIGKKFNNVAMKPSLTLWYDHLSGTDDSDITVAANPGEPFNTLLDTGHKFYGHMDLFLSNINHGTGGLGLTDLAVKASLQPMPGWTVKFAWHKFQTDDRS